MGEYRGRGDFRSGPAMIVINVLVAIVFATGAFMTYRERGWYWVSVGLACGTVFSLAAIVETLVLRVRLTDDALVVTDLRGRRQYSRGDVASVHEAKGSPTLLVLRDGRKVRLPLVGDNLGNSIRAWIRYPAGARSPTELRP